MKNYRLTYEQPREFDEDSPSGIGDHQIAYDIRTLEFTESSDEGAWIRVDQTLATGQLNFGFHLGSEAAGLYPRKFLRLDETVADRVVERPS